MKDYTQTSWQGCRLLPQLALLLGISLAITTPLAQAQDQTLQILRQRAPTNDSLSVGFTPDPRTFQLSAGGISLMNINPDCVGFFAEQPEALILEYGGSDNLGIFVNADADTVLAVIDANGDLHCNDDHALLSNNNPGVQLSPAPEGRIAIMVGVYDTADIGTEATVAVTEFGPSMWQELDLGGDFNNLITNIASTDIEFGDDSGSFANDGECDDPRFLGDGSAMFPSDDHEFHDASDCSVLYGLGQVQLLDQFINAAPAAAAGPSAVEPGSPEIEFGDNSSAWANDGECDDPRFSGDGMASVTVEDDRLHDANDCRNLFEQGAISLSANVAGSATASAQAAALDGDVDFGDDNGDWANDGECDDPRFEGDGMASVTVDEDIRHDASDCRNLYSAGLIQFIGPDQQALSLLESLAAVPGDLTNSDTQGSFGGFADRFSFVTGSGETAVINLVSSDFDTYLRVTSPSGEVFINDDFQSSIGRSVIIIETTEVGEYQVEVTSFGVNETGSYSLQMGSSGSAETVADQV